MQGGRLLQGRWNREVPQCFHPPRSHLRRQMLAAPALALPWFLAPLRLRPCHSRPQSRPTMSTADELPLIVAPSRRRQWAVPLLTIPASLRPEPQHCRPQQSLALPSQKRPPLRHRRLLPSPWMDARSPPRRRNPRCPAHFCGLRLPRPIARTPTSAHRTPPPPPQRWLCRHHRHASAVAGCKAPACLQRRRTGKSCQHAYRQG
mmetsp:Transcript_114947/g.330103  ORF Transcript_114947/g.330103 Transcript_114947/m.330103 type:complete len:204 (-) Transcript_114947:1254-1865(-)